jgi:glutaminyl-tRNA synthetase
VHCTFYPDSRSGSPGAEKYKVKGNIHWVSAKHAYRAKVNLYDRLFTVPEPGKERDFLQDINPDSKRIIEVQAEPGLREARARQSFQFERHGYFVVDDDGRSFNRTVTLRDTWKP